MYRYNVARDGRMASPHKHLLVRAVPTNSGSAVTADLDGLLVVALEQAVAAPYCTARLADAGARVIKVERPEGDFARRYDRLALGESSHFVWLNRGKQSVRLDLKTDADRTLLSAMLARADVLVQNLGPGVMERLGFGSAALRDRHPWLITCDISGYGQAGPYSSQKAYDLLVQAESGLCSINGGPDGPARVGVSVADIACGLNAYAGVLEALVARGISGRGRGVEVSLFDSLAEWMNVPDLQWRYGQSAPARMGLHHPSIAPYGAYACAHGEAILLAIQNEAEWQRFCADVLDRPALADDARFATMSDRVAHRAALDAMIDVRFSPLDRESVVALLEHARIAYGRLSSLADLANHPQRREWPIDTEVGPMTILAPPTAPEAAAKVRRRVPALGEHDALVRAEFGVG